MIHELRTYHIVEGKMDVNHKAFTDVIIPILTEQKAGFSGFWEQQDNDRRTFVYMLSFDDNDHMKRAWGNFGGDERWKGFLAGLGDEKVWEGTESVVLESTEYSNA
jgi:hypothetical protein